MSSKLCTLVKKGICEDDPKEFKKIVKDAKHWCKKCGRVAVDSDKLCKPKKI